MIIQLLFGHESYDHTSSHSVMSQGIISVLSAPATYQLRPTVQSLDHCLQMYAYYSSI